MGVGTRSTSERQIFYIVLIKNEVGTYFCVEKMKDIPLKVNVFLTLPLTNA